MLADLIGIGISLIEIGDVTTTNRRLLSTGVQVECIICSRFLNITFATKFNENVARHMNMNMINTAIEDDDYLNSLLSDGITMVSEPIVITMFDELTGTTVVSKATGIIAVGETQVTTPENFLETIPLWMLIGGGSAVFTTMMLLLLICFCCCSKRRKTIIPNANPSIGPMGSKITGNFQEIRSFPYTRYENIYNNSDNGVPPSRISQQPTIFPQPIGFSQVPTILQRRQPLIQEPLPYIDPMSTHVFPLTDIQSQGLDTICIPIDMIIPDSMENRIPDSRQSHKKSGRGILNYKML
jgi:hypothetical protein